MKEKITRAISIRQPYAELILQGKKKLEFRSIPTNIRERVYIYASLTEANDAASWRKVNRSPSVLPKGVIVGSVEIVGCNEHRNGGYAYSLQRPKRAKPYLQAKNQPSPVFWKPVFENQGTAISPNTGRMKKLIVTFDRYETNLSKKFRELRQMHPAEKALEIISSALSMEAQRLRKIAKHDFVSKGLVMVEPGPKGSIQISGPRIAIESMTEDGFK